MAAPITYHAFESHLDRFDIQGAEVLVIPLPRAWTGAIVGRTDYPDLLVRLTERAPAEAAEALQEQMTPRLPLSEDWPDLLASDLIVEQKLHIAAWARSRGLHPGSVSRGFRQQYGVTPAGFRLYPRRPSNARNNGHGQSSGTDRTLLQLLVQSHMSNAVRSLTGLPPSRLRG